MLLSLEHLELGGRALLEVLGPVPAELVRLRDEGRGLISHYSRCYYSVEGFGLLVAASMGTRLSDDLGPVPGELVRLALSG